MTGDPLLHFHGLFGFNKGLIERVSAGEKYVGVMLKTGEIGVCSTLNSHIDKGDLEVENPALDRPAQRILYNAYLNALLNYNIPYEDDKDIFQHIDFSVREKVVMIGFFRPLVKKFNESGFDLTIFDYLEKDEVLTPLKEMNSFLATARTVILTSTSISNGTMNKVLAHTSPSCDVFLLGPSSILHPDMKRYRNIRKIYGAVFKPYDHHILDIISRGNGTRSFLKYGKKVNI